MKEMSNKIKNETIKNVAKCPRLTKEEREARKLKIQEERAAKKAARLAKREAKKQKEAEKKAAAKAKREERKAKKAARLLAEKERKAAMKLKKQERAEAKKAREAARAEKKAERLAKKNNDEKKALRDKNKTDNVKKVSIEDKIEYERNEWKALSAIRRYVKDEAKALGTLDGVRLERRLKKLEKMGYEVKLENGVPLTIGYSFSTVIKVSKVAGPKTEKTEKAQKPQKIKEETKEVKVQQPQDSVEPQIPAGDGEEEEEEKLLTDEEILAAAAEDKETQSVEVLAGDTFKDETEIANDDSLGNFDDDDDNDDENEDEDEDEDDTDDDDDDIFGTGGNVSREQEDYRREAFRDMEANGAWD